LSTGDSLAQICRTGDGWSRRISFYSVSFRLSTGKDFFAGPAAADFLKERAGLGTPREPSIVKL
jgi:hypothetical protein